MRYVAAYLLAVLGGNNHPSEADIKKILSSVGIDADETQLKKVISELKDKNIEDVLAEGRLKLASMPAAAPGGAPAAAAGGKTPDAPKAEEKKEEPKKEESEDEDEDMGFGLFD